jgi:hypothetical protein
MDGVLVIALNRSIKNFLVWKQIDSKDGGKVNMRPLQNQRCLRLLP